MTLVRKTASPGQYLTFALNGQTYGAPIHCVREINRMAEITPLPQTPDYVMGVINLRGKVIPVVDLRRRLGFEAIQPTKTTCIIVIDGPHGSVGGVVDAVHTVHTFSSEQIEAPPQVSNDKTREHLLGIGKLENGIAILLDIVNTVAADSALQGYAGMAA